jgi:hypothetical protein
MFWKKKNEVVEDVKDTSARVVDVVRNITDDIRAELVGTTVNEVEQKMKAILEAEDSIVRLNKEKAVLEETIAKLKSKARIEETEIKALLKVTEEKASIEAQKKELDLQKEFQDKAAELTNAYHKDLAEGIAAERKRLDEFMDKVMDRLTNINNKELSGAKVKVIK